MGGGGKRENGRGHVQRPNNLTNTPCKQTALLPSSFLGNEVFFFLQKHASPRRHHQYRSDLFSASSTSTPPPPPPLPGPIVISIHADTQYPAAASTALTELPFSCNNRPDHHSINAPVQSLHVCLSANECSTPATCLICYSKPSVWKGPYNTTLHSCRTQLHHMPSTNPILSISHPILGSLSKQEKKKKEQIQTLL